MPLSRSEMEAVISGGGSVLHGGRIITRVQDLPSEAELAQGNPDATQAAQARLEAEVARLQEQLARLQQQPPAAPSGGEPPPAPKGKKAAEAKDGGESKAEEG